MCVDATHKTNGYDFPLITVVVVDEFGEGYPVAWCISNREDTKTLKVFFEKLKEICGDIKTSWLMTDMAEQYYIAWSAVFGPGTKKILCTWHVDRAWRGHLKFIQSKEVQATVYHSLRVLLDETDCDTFELLLKATAEQLHANATTQAFAAYFNQYYVKHKTEWAACYRKGAGLNTNMYVESFHRVLKHVYLCGKVNKRMDKCIHKLLLYARDKAFDRLIKLHKGKSTHCLVTIATRHRQSFEVPHNNIDESSDNTWMVRSTNSDHVYHVVKETDMCPLSCSMRCNDCNICIHNYTCTCPDALIRHTICKHIHAVVRLANNPSKMDINNLYENPNEESVECILKAIKHNKEDVECEKETIRHKLTILTAQIQNCNSARALFAAKTHLNFASNILQVMCNETDTVSSIKSCPVQEPANKNVTLQKRFFSTRKSKTANVRLAKPSPDQKIYIRTCLMNTKPLYYPNGDSKEDPSPSKLPNVLLCQLLSGNANNTADTILQWVSNKSAAQRSLEGKEPVSLGELNIDGLPDEIIDVDVLSLRKYIQNPAWKHLLQRSMLYYNYYMYTVYT